MDLFIFPFEKIERGSKVVIYGAGEFGKSSVDQILHRNYANIICIVDRCVEGLYKDIPIYKFERLHEITNRENIDYFIVASGNFSSEMVGNLINCGICCEKIYFEWVQISKQHSD